MRNSFRGTIFGRGVGEIPEACWARAMACRASICCSGSDDASLVNAVGIAETHCVEFGDVGFYLQVHVPSLGFGIFDGLKTDELIQNADDRPEFFRRVKIGTDIDADNDVDPRGAHLVHGIVVQHAAVHQQGGVDGEGGEQRRERAAGAHGFRQVAPIQFDGGAVLQVGGLGKIRDGEAVELVDRVGGDGPVGEFVDQVLPVRDGRGKLQFETVHSQAESHSSFPLFVVVEAVAARCFVLYDLQNVEILDQRVDLFGAPSGGVQSADDCPDGGPSDVVDVYPGLFDHLDGAQVCEAFGTATRKDHPDFQPITLMEGVLGSGRQRGRSLEKFRSAR